MFIRAISGTILFVVMAAASAFSDDSTRVMPSDTVWQKVTAKDTTVTEQTKYVPVIVKTIGQVKPKSGQIHYLDWQQRGAYHDYNKMKTGADTLVEMANNIRVIHENQRGHFCVETRSTAVMKNRPMKSVATDLENNSRSLSETARTGILFPGKSL